MNPRAPAPACGPNTQHRSYRSVVQRVTVSLLYHTSVRDGRSSQSASRHLQALTRRVAALNTTTCVYFEEFPRPRSVHRDDRLRPSTRGQLAVACRAKLEQVYRVQARYWDVVRSLLQVDSDSESASTSSGKACFPEGTMFDPRRFEAENGLVSL